MTSGCSNLDQSHPQIYQINHAVYWNFFDVTVVNGEYWIAESIKCVTVTGSYQIDWNGTVPCKECWKTSGCWGVGKGEGCTFQNGGYRVKWNSKVKMQFMYQSCTNYFVCSMKLQCYNPCSGTLKCAIIFTIPFFFSFSLSGMVGKLR